ncbi:MAG: hypothetical protein RIT43_2472 [Bacteroidota bacterium]|jgi:Leucine-rich repeat (LRR) protein
MSKTFALSLIFLWFSLLKAQENLTYYTWYTWDQVAHASPDTIYAISFAKEKRTEVPAGLGKFKKLRALDLSKNQLITLTDEIALLDSLEYLDISKNKLDVFPIQLCRLTHLKTLILNRNNFSEIPECIKYLRVLEFLDLWSTPVTTFPNGISELTSLKILDLQGNRYSPTFHKSLKSRLEWVEIRLDPPCDCME